jgi:diketogulonate reductase-like aldo/keto reductase
MKLAQRDDRNAIDAATLDRIALEVARLSPLVRTMPAAARASEASRGLLERMKKRDHVGVTLAELALRYVIDRGVVALPRLHRHTLVTDALIAASSDPLPEQAIAWMTREQFLDDKT